ncbi:MAG: hypothetical protein LBP87_09565 [Planctomycetaceae bacterium]|jgi:hypothetical protein|nr:hypothetical protein [Planctomycetaceae bacterium]
MERIRKFDLLVLLLFLTLVVSGCQQALLTALVLVNGTDVKPKYDILLKGEKRVAVVCRSMASNPYDVQNAPREISRQTSKLIDLNVRNKKLKVVEPAKVEAWLDNCNNDFDNFLEIGRDKTIDADIVIGIEIRGFQTRDPHSPYLVQGKSQVNVKAIDCSNGEVLASEDLLIIDPPNLPISGGPGMEAAFRPRFIQVIAEQIAILFHHHDPHKSKRIDADNLDMHRLH